MREQLIETAEKLLEADGAELQVTLDEMLRTEDVIRDDLRIPGGRLQVKRHAADFVANRLASVQPQNDGKQTPMRGHPVFLAQHATATCCRGCLEKWHNIPKGTPLTETQQQYVVDVVMQWIKRQMQQDKGR